MLCESPDHPKIDFYFQLFTNKIKLNERFVGDSYSLRQNALRNLPLPSSDACSLTKINHSFLTEELFALILLLEMIKSGYSVWRVSRLERRFFEVVTKSLIMN